MNDDPRSWSFDGLAGYMAVVDAEGYAMTDDGLRQDLAVEHLYLEKLTGSAGDCDPRCPICAEGAKP